MHTSQNNADQSAAALVDNALKCLPQLALRVRGHPFQLGLQVLADDLMEAAPEDIGLPQLAGIALKLLSSDCFSFPTIGETVVSISARIKCIEGALARIRTP